MCATHGEYLGSASPLWGLVVVNHWQKARGWCERSAGQQEGLVALETALYMELDQAK